MEGIIRTEAFASCLVLCNPAASLIILPMAEPSTNIGTTRINHHEDPLWDACGPEPDIGVDGRHVLHAHISCCFTATRAAPKSPPPSYRRATLLKDRERKFVQGDMLHLHSRLLPHYIVVGSKTRLPPMESPPEPNTNMPCKEGTSMSALSTSCSINYPWISMEPKPNLACRE